MRCTVEQRPTDHRLVPGELDYATTKKDSDLDADADAAKVPWFVDPVGLP